MWQPVVWGAALAWVSMAQTGAAQETPGITAADVQQAIDEGVAFLKSQQRPDGSWPGYENYAGGATSLATLALLNCGVDPADESVAPALALLRQIPPQHTYSTALQTMVFATAEPDRDGALLGRNVRWLEQSQAGWGPAAGGWSYRFTPGGQVMVTDNSNSQFALLALYEAERAGVRVDIDTLRRAKTYWARCQNSDGSWSYQGRGAGSGSMTCAGIASVIIADDMIGRLDASVERGRIRCCGQDVSKEEDPVERALAWLAENFSVARNPLARGGSGSWHLYYLYGMERAGRLVSQRFIGEHDWYREGAAQLLKMRGANGGWGDSIETSFALLFLSKGRWPVVVAKLRHGDPANWNRHRHDVHNLTRHVEQRWRRNLTWQVIDLDRASVEDLREAPVLYYCGEQNPLRRPAAEQQALAQKLRDYVDRGGFIFAESYCGSDGFDQGFRALMKLVFPEPEYSLQVLPPEHPIWRAEQMIAADQLRTLMGIEYGCRTSVVYVPKERTGKPSLSCLWELARGGRDQQYAQGIQRQIDAGLAIGANVIAYATNRELDYKDAAIHRPEEARTGEAARRSIRIASLRHPGGCTAAPRALGNLLRSAVDQLGIRASTEQQELDITDPALFEYHLVFMHGRNSFRLTDAERARLRTYVERGGMLLANSLCSSPTFSESFRREMGEIFNDRPMERISATDSLLTAAYGGYDLSQVVRRVARSPEAAETLRPGPAELEGIRFHDRFGVIFSPYDLSCALNQQDSPGCPGYVRADAARIGQNVLLYSLQQ
ncbi:MAG: terpene cyclase/mutase family protein [Thermoguttaceae bacterium]|nr:terpene cyclase/mutase family protein [Thermoguttaceae bacterium]